MIELIILWVILAIMTVSGICLVCLLWYITFHSDEIEKAWREEVKGKSDE